MEDNTVIALISFRVCVLYGIYAHRTISQLLSAASDRSLFDPIIPCRRRTLVPSHAVR